jgi:hypothetical protein
VKLRGASVSMAKRDALRTIRDVVRLGRVPRVEPDRMVLDQSDIQAGCDAAVGAGGVLEPTGSRISTGAAWARRGLRRAQVATVPGKCGAAILS